MLASRKTGSHERQNWAGGRAQGHDAFGHARHFVAVFAAPRAGARAAEGRVFAVASSAWST